MVSFDLRILGALLGNGDDRTTTYFSRQYFRRLGQELIKGKIEGQGIQRVEIQVRGKTIPRLTSTFDRCLY